MEIGLETFVAQFGVAGVIICGLMWDRFRILKDNDTLQKEVRDLYRENNETLKEVAAALQGQASKAG